MLLLFFELKISVWVDISVEWNEKQFFKPPKTKVDLIVNLDFAFGNSKQRVSQDQRQIVKADPTAQCLVSWRDLRNSIYIAFRHVNS
jgi:hypothetical protein